VAVWCRLYCAELGSTSCWSYGGGGIIELRGMQGDSIFQCGSSGYAAVRKRGRTA